MLQRVIAASTSAAGQRNAIRPVTRCNARLQGTARVCISFGADGVQPARFKVQHVRPRVLVCVCVCMPARIRPGVYDRVH